MGVCLGATMQCSFGLAPSTLSVLPVRRVVHGGMPQATVMDNVPLINIPPFGMCMSLANPTVAAATAAALGVLTPMPCLPVIPAPWVPGATRTLVGGVPALDQTCKATCTYGGVISILTPGQMRATVS